MFHTVWHLLLCIRWVITLVRLCVRLLTLDQQLTPVTQLGHEHVHK